ncbi:polymorphic toxin-type HINT domain-containing protein [Kitasatospora sp. NPDC001540]|uniref:polymorphic toxin-type HINT domain-containing protein n=1 Tax=Kitasatospora sp. NPDC001540 TaxID=3364014 RepID=UPI0036C976B0
MLTGLLAAPSAEALAAKHRGRDWKPKAAVTGLESVKGADLVPAKPKAPDFPVPRDWQPSAQTAAAPSGSAEVVIGSGSAAAKEAAAATGGASPSSGGRGLVKAGSLPVALGVGGGGSAAARSVKVEVAEQAKGRAAGVSGPVVALTDGTDPDAKTDRKVTVELDLKAWGAQWADRARLVALPACALTTPDKPECRVQTPVESRVDVASGRLSADVVLPGATSGAVKSSANGPGGTLTQASFPTASGTAVQASAGTAAPMVLAATASSSGASGSYQATSLSPSAAWSAGTNVGNFTYSYPVQVPAGIAGATPSVALSYDSSALDGRTSSANAQSSWIGDGWGYEPGFVERSYQSCSKDGITGSADLCWGGQNASISLAGHSGTLVRDDTSGVWHLMGDDGTKVELLTGAPNGLKNGEYWKVTVADGTQYWFGQNHLPGGDGTDPATNSAWSEPVYSPNSGDPCYNSTTGKASWCSMGWRWNLDYVVDLHQNLISYTYATETNNYSRGAGQNSGNGTLTPYVRAGYPTQIAYGQRLPEQTAAHGTLNPAAKVVFTTSERCLPSGPITCDPAQRTAANASFWPDVPVDQLCTTSCTVPNPSFFSTKRLTGISTQVLVGTAYRTVDTWTLTHSFPDPGDGTKPTLWLASIQRTGTNGQAEAKLPAVSFTARELANRVDGLVPAQPAFNRPRIQQITTETGGQITVSYSDPECSRVNNHMPSSEDGNTMACQPVHWYLPGSSSPDPVNDWFNKYLVTAVAEQDAVTGSLMVKKTSYTYNGGAAWHRNDAEWTDPKTRTWDNFRGYQSVDTFLGTGNAGEAPRTQQRVTYLRGMDGDVLANGTRRSVSVANPLGGSVTDSDWLAGSTVATEVYDQAGGQVVAVNGGTSNGQQVTATHKQSGGMPDLVARYPASQITSVAKSKLTDGSWRTTTMVATTDPAHANRELQVDDKGDGTAATPEVCTTTGYATSSNPALVNLVSEKKSVAGPCGTAANAATTLADVRTLYDSKPFGQAGTLAEATGAQTLDHYDAAGNPVYVNTATTTFDVYGRPVSDTTGDGSTYDAAGNQLTGRDPAANAARTTTSYTPATGAIPTTVTSTNPMGGGWTSTATQDPGRNLPLTSTDLNGRTTTQQYDGLGRLTAVWRPGRATNLSPDNKFSYAVNGVTAPSVVTSQSHVESAGDVYLTTTQLYDGLGRIRQTQTNSAATWEGRLVTDTFYDSHGWVTGTSDPHYDKTTSPNGTVFVAADYQVLAQTRLTYDGMGRVTKSEFKANGQPQWSTTTAYPGADRTDVTPPRGGTPTTTFNDARGRTTALWQYHGSTPTGSAADADVTTYAYTPSGQTASRTDSQGNTWSYGYDLRGRLVSSTDPDTGTSRTAYDVNSQVASTTNAKGDTLAYSYDLLGRKTGLYAGSVAPANQLAGWTYDTVSGAKGHPASSTRYVGGATGKAYTTAVTGYDTDYRVTGSSVTIPSSEGKLAGTYTTTNAYTPVLGLLDHTNLPAVGGLPAEEVDYLYSDTGLMWGSAGLSSLITDVHYDELGRPTQTKLGDDGTFVSSTQTYDPATGRITQSVLERQTSTTAVDTTNYTYDPAGRITSVSDIQGPSATDTQCFTYDHLGRLTNAWTDTAGTTTAPMPSVPGIGACVNANGPATTPGPASTSSVGGPSPYWQTYGYDATGNRTSLVQHDITGNTAKDVTTTQTFGAPKSVNTPTTAPNTGGGTGGPHGLLSTSTKSASGTTATTYQYDAVGNTTSITDTSGTTTLTWDGEDKLASVTKTGEAQGTSYLYDADGNQLIRRNPGKTTLNLGSDELTLDTTTNTLSDARYYGAPGGLTITRVTSDNGNGTLVYQCADPHGTSSVQIGTDAAQTVTRRPTDPFGNPRGTQPAPNTWSGDKGFVGGTLDTATGLTNLGAREYDPVHGRFVNPDPLLDEGSPQQWNGYAYSGNNPVNSSDPSGLMTNANSADGGEFLVPHPEAFCVTLSCAQQTSTPEYWQQKITSDGNFAAAQQQRGTSSDNGNGSGGNGRGTKKCTGNFLEKGICHTGNGLKRIQNYTTDHPLVRAVVVAVVEGVAGALCYGGGIAGALETGGTSAVAAATGCAAAVGALGAAVDNALDGNADHSAGGILQAEVIGAVTSVATEGTSAVLGQELKQAGSAAAKKIGGWLGGGCKNSFPAGTAVLLADGTVKPIDQLTDGDTVLATDPQTGETRPEPVTDTIVTPDDTEFTDLTLTTKAGTEALTSTQHHPYWDLTTNRWTNAADLKPGDHVLTTDGQTVTVETVHNYRTEPRTAYNLTIADLHTYYVLAGTTPVLVHNCPPGIGSIFKRAKQEGPAPNATVRDLASIEIRDVGGTAGSSTQMDALKGLSDDDLLASVFTPKSGPKDVLTVGLQEKVLQNGNHRAYLLKAAADRHRRTGQGKITWDTPIYIRDYERWAG